MLSACTRDHQKKKEDFAPVPEETQPTEADDDGGDEVQFVDKFVGVDETINTVTVNTNVGQSKEDVLETRGGERNEEGCKIGMEKNEEGRKIGMEKNEEGCEKKNEEGRTIGMEKNEERCKKKNEGGRKIGMEKNEKGCKKKNEGGRKIGMEKNEEGCKKKNEGGRKIGMEKKVEGRKIGMEKQVKAQPSSDAANVDKTHDRNIDPGITVDPVLRLFDSKWIQM